MLKQTNCVKSALNTAGVTLEADVGESFLVKAIYVGRCTTDAYLVAKIDNYTVAAYLVKGKAGNQLGTQRLAYSGYNLMALLVEKGLPFSLPIAEGQKLSIAALDGIGLIQVVYDTYDAGDIRSDMSNGTASKVYGFIQYMREGSVIAASGDLLLDTSLSPPEFPDFPAGKSVPANMTIKLHGIHGSPVSDAASGSNLFYSSYLKLIREREVLLDEDRNGIPFLANSAEDTGVSYTEGESIIGQCGEASGELNMYNSREPLWFDPALVFVSGEELLVYLTFVKVGTHTMTADDPAVDLILEVNRT